MRWQLVAVIWLAISAVESGLSLPPNGPALAQVGGQLDAQREYRARVDATLAKSGQNGFRCATPSTAEIGRCAATEQRLLESVVRLEVRSLDEGGRWVAEISYGTVMGGRYLVTHNHFNVRLSLLEEAVAGVAASASLYRADGERIWPSGEPIDFEVVAEDSETLVLDFGVTGPGQGFFDSLGLCSASFQTHEAFRLRPGTEVAKLDWSDGEAYLEWVRVEAVRVESGTATLVLSADSQPGSSGGGVFWQGHHIANNWTTVEVFDDSGLLVRRYSEAALNTGIIRSLLE